MVTPFLIIVVTIIAVYYFITGHLDFQLWIQTITNFKHIRLVGGLMA